MVKEPFFGRESQLELLEKRIRSFKDGYRQNLAIIGDELVGKTSLVVQFLKRFSDNQLLLLYVEVRPEPLAAFARRFIGVLLYTFLTNSGMALKEELEFLVAKAERYIPMTVGKIRLILEALTRRKKLTIFTELLSLTELIHQETGKSCVVIFDEFTHLEQVDTRSVYREWAKAIVAQKQTMYLLSSSFRFKARSILSKDLSLLFGNFEVTTVGPFDTRTSDAYLSFRLSAQGITLEQGLRDFIINFTGGYPFYLNAIVDRLNPPGRRQLVALLDDLLFCGSGMLHQRFTVYLKYFSDLSYGRDYAELLYLIASGHSRIKELAQRMGLQRRELDARIGYLCEWDALARSGDFLRLNDRVFGFWLRFVYQAQLESLTFDAKNQRERFRQNIESLIEEFLLSAQRPVVERLTDILRLFEDEVAQIERKKFRLVHFREIKPLEFSNRSLKHWLIGRSHDALWIMAVKPDMVTEEDIAEFSRECKKYRQRSQQKIIVALHDIDANARLRALEEKISTWDLNHLNQLFDLYSKPRVIV